MRVIKTPLPHSSSPPCEGRALVPAAVYLLSSLRRSHLTLGRRRRRRLSAGLELPPAAQRRRPRVLVTRAGVARVSDAVGVQVRAHRGRGVTRTSARAWARARPLPRA